MFQHIPVMIEKIMNTLNHNSQYPGRSFNWGHLEFKAGFWHDVQ
jgi:hypothetical protein